MLGGVIKSAPSRLTPSKQGRAAFLEQRLTNGSAAAGVVAPNDAVTAASGSLAIGARAKVNGLFLLLMIGLGLGSATAGWRWGGLLHRRAVCSRQGSNPCF